MSTPQLRTVKKVLAARARRGLATAPEVRRLNYTRRILCFRRDVYEAGNEQMGDRTP
jgi:hypothetical protein